MDRNNNNKLVFAKANAIKNPKKQEGKNILPFSEYIHKQQAKLLAHTIRATEEDPLRQCTLDKNSNMPYKPGPKRVGRPRNNWTWKTYERICLKHSPATKTTFKENPELYIGMVVPGIRNKSIKL